MARTVGWDLEAVFEERDSPAQKNDDPQRLGVMSLQMAVPSERHEDIGKQKEERSLANRRHGG